MSGPGPKIDWLADTLARTNNSINPAQVAPAVEFGAMSAPGPSISLALTVDMAGMLAVIWTSSTPLADAAATNSGILFDSDEAAVVNVLGANAAYLVLLKSTDVLLIVSHALDADFYVNVAPLSSGMAVASSVLAFPGP